MTEMMIKLKEIKLYKSFSLISSKLTYLKNKLLKRGQLWTPICKLPSELFKKYKEEGKESSGLLKLLITLKDKIKRKIFRNKKILTLMIQKISKINKC